jgi:hypothetical protein
MIAVVVHVRRRSAQARTSAVSAIGARRRIGAALECV